MILFSPKRRKHSDEHEKLIKALEVIGYSSSLLVVNSQDSVDIPAELASVLNELLEQKAVIESLILPDETLKQLFKLLQVSNSTNSSKMNF